MKERQSIEATYDSREDGFQYELKQFIDGKCVQTETLPDPFARATIYVKQSRIRALLGKKQKVVFQLSPKNKRIEDDVMELDNNYLASNSSRKREFSQGVVDFMRAISVIEEVSAVGVVSEQVKDQTDG